MLFCLLHQCLVKNMFSWGVDEVKRNAPRCCLNDAWPPFTWNPWYISKGVFNQKSSILKLIFRPIDTVHRICAQIERNTIEWFWGRTFESVITYQFMHTSCEIALRWMPYNTFDNSTRLVQVMFWCRKATIHYLPKIRWDEMRWDEMRWDESSQDETIQVKIILFKVQQITLARWALIR